AGCMPASSLLQRGIAAATAFRPAVPPNGMPPDATNVRKHSETFKVLNFRNPPIYCDPASKYFEDRAILIGWPGHRGPKDPRYPGEVP
ncbi:MAG TPA: hypothetical protein VMF51_06165, partial [Nocardioides sp.]|uniref:hypothetical protein n=1 Tax=Nocardioides sp. TaxID=35761 RepID=UPI002C586FBE